MEGVSPCRVVRFKVPCDYTDTGRLFRVLSFIMSILCFLSLTSTSKFPVLVSVMFFGLPFCRSISYLFTLITSISARFSLDNAFMLIFL